MNLKVKLNQLLFVLSFFVLCKALPIEDDAVEIVANGIDENSVDPEVIDLTSLGPEAFGAPTDESGVSVSTWNETSLVNPEEMGEYVQGDILIPDRPSFRNGIREQALKWTNGIVPYYVGGDFNQAQTDTIRKAIADYHRLTCLRFVPYSGEQDYISIESKNTGCWSSVGRIGGRQEVNLQIPGCVSKKGTVLHELLHAVGFMHEQSRPERDDFVHVRYQNIKYGAENNFKKADSRNVDGYGVPYDYNSVMHYSEYAFSRNNQKTIESKVGGIKLGQREGLSRGDVRKVNNMYDCKKEEPQSGWFGSIFKGPYGREVEFNAVTNGYYEMYGSYT